MDGQFFPGQAIQFEGDFVAPPESAPPPVEYSFNMTSGGVFGWFGYLPSGGIGSIDAEPIPGYPLAQFLYIDGASFIAFAGNCVALLTGKTVWVGGVEYSINFSGWSLESGNTGGLWETGGPVFVSGVSYFVEIK